MVWQEQTTVTCTVKHHAAIADGVQELAGARRMAATGRRHGGFPEILTATKAREGFRVQGSSNKEPSSERFRGMPVGCIEYRDGVSHRNSSVRPAEHNQE